MSKLRANRLFEPFAELVKSNGVDLYIFGYRTGQGEIISSVSVPATVVGSVFWETKAMVATISPDGRVTAGLCDVDPWGAKRGNASIDELIEAAVSPTNLLMEEATIQDLNTLLRRLERAVSLVKSAIS